MGCGHRSCRQSNSSHGVMILSKRFLRYIHLEGGRNGCPAQARVLTNRAPRYVELPSDVSGGSITRIPARTTLSLTRLLRLGLNNSCRMFRQRYPTFKGRSVQVRRYWGILISALTYTRQHLHKSRWPFEVHTHPSPTTPLRPARIPQCRRR